MGREPWFITPTPQSKREEVCFTFQLPTLPKTAGLGLLNLVPQWFSYLECERDESDGCGGR